jgi:AraC-like DNA-binding protein
VFDTRVGTLELRIPKLRQVTNLPGELRCDEGSRQYTTSTDLSTPVQRGMTAHVTSRSAAAQHLRDLAQLRRVRDRIDREYAQPLDVEALARGVNMSAGHLSRQFRRAYGEPPYAYLMTRRIERAMALLRRGDLSVTEVCFAVGCSSLGTFSSRFTELVGVPPSVYRRQAARATAGMPSCVAKQVTRPIRNQEVRSPSRS